MRSIALPATDAPASIAQTTVVDNAFAGGANTLPYACLPGYLILALPPEAFALTTWPAALAGQVAVCPNPAWGTAQLSRPSCNASH